MKKPYYKIQIQQRLFQNDLVGLVRCQHLGQIGLGLASLPRSLPGHDGADDLSSKGAGPRKPGGAQDGQQGHYKAGGLQAGVLSLNRDVLRPLRGLGPTGQ